MRQWTLACACIVLCALFATQARAERRVALVIANAAYQNTRPLPNPRNDGTDIAAALKAAQFEVIEGYDLDKRGMDDAFRRFARAANGADAALFYYGGHAMQFEGANYLMPVDAKLASEEDVPYEMAKVQDVLNELQRAKGMRILLLDGCRDNPLADRLLANAGKASRSGGATRGLARIQETSGTIIAYATQAGAVAADGDGRNSPFARAFLTRVGEPGLEAGRLFRLVSRDVFETTDGKQLPEISMSVLGDFYFHEGAPVPAPATPGQQVAVAAVPAAPARTALLAACDRLASSPEDPDRPADSPGVPPDNIDAKSAVPACRAAAEAAPETGRIQFQYGRALQAAGDSAGARSAYEAAVKAGSGSAAANLSLVLAMGEGGPADLARSASVVEAAAAAGNPAAMRILAYQYAQGMARKRDMAQAFAWYSKAAEAGNVTAMTFLANLYQSGEGGPVDHAKAAQLFDRAARAGNSHAMRNVAYQFELGQGRPRDPAQAAAWYGKAAAAGDPLAMGKLAMFYRNGQGVPKDTLQAKAWIDRLYATDIPNAMVLTAADMLGSSDLVKDYGTARRLLTRAAELGDGEAELRLAVMSGTGEGSAPDFVAARKHLDRAMSLNNHDARAAAAIYYIEGGFGLKADPRLGAAHLLDALRKGSPMAYRFLVTDKGQLLGPTGRLAVEKILADSDLLGRKPAKRFDEATLAAFERIAASAAGR